MEQTIDIKGGSKIPSYVAVYDLLYQDIVNGVYKKDSPLPGETFLANKYQVSRNTLRQALTILVQDGYIYKQQGKGTFVSYDKTREEKRDIYNFILDCTTEKITSVKIDYNVDYPTKIAKNKLRLNEEEKVFASNNVYWGKNSPIAHSFLQIPMAFLERHNISVEDSDTVGNNDSADGNNSIDSTKASAETDALNKLMNVLIYERAASAELSIQCIPADKQTIPFLSVEKNTPLLYLEQILYNLENVPIARIKYYLKPDKYKVILHT